MPQFDDVAREAETLEPDDRVRLISRLWISLPKEHWASPRERERAEIEAMLCGDDTAGMAAWHQEVTRRMEETSQGGELPRIYSAPRRFDLATIFVVTLAYSFLFAGLKSLDALPVVSLAIGSFITIVGAAQPLLFKGRNPRLASMIAGALAMVPLSILGAMGLPRAMPAEAWIMVMPISMTFGVFFGYLAGTLVGGVFLVADLVRSALTRTDVTHDAVETDLVEADTANRGIG